MTNVPQRVLVPLGIAVLTVSDTRTAETDRSGDTLVSRITLSGHRLAARSLVQDDTDAIEAALRAWIADPAIDVVISTGGTGLTGRDVTPEAFGRVLEKQIPGFGELFRMQSLAKIGVNAMLSRALGGIAAGKYLFALPGSPGAAADAWDNILSHQFDSRDGTCNLAELLPRLRER